MSKLVSVDYDVKEDAWNWWGAVNDQNFGHDFGKTIPIEIREKIKGKKFPEVKSFLCKTIRKKYYKTADFKFINKKFLPFWDKKEPKIIKKLNEIHKRPFPVKKVTLLYTTIARSPYEYKKKEFLIWLGADQHDKEYMVDIIIHELMHLYFHHYYFEYCLENGLTYGETHAIKEAVTVLMNEEMQEMLVSEDKGYKIHQELRKYILEEWRKSKDFEKLIGTLIVGFNEKHLK